MADLLGLEAALGAPWSDEQDSVVSADELVALLGGGPVPLPDQVLDEAIALGILEVHGDRFRVLNRSGLEVTALLVAAGVPLEAIVASGWHLRRDIDDVAGQFVELVDRHVFERLGEPPAAGTAGDLAELIGRLRPLAKRVVDVELSRAMERHIRARFGEHLSRFADSVGRGATEAS